MNNNKIISQIRILKKIQPSQEKLEIVKAQLDMRLEKEQSSSFTPSTSLLAFRPRFLYILFPVVSFVFILFLLYQNPLFLQDMMFRFQYALMPSPFEKAAASLTYTEAQLHSILPQQTTSAELTSLDNATTQTDAMLKQLNLSGVYQEYTDDQCFALYLGYKAYLDRAEDQLLDVKKNSSNNVVKVKAGSLRNTMQQYEKNIDSRLRFYK